MADTLIVNLFGGPGAGKSIIAASCFACLKAAGINCELAPEFAKDLVWDGIPFLMKQNPIWVFSEQYRRILRLIGKVDVIVADSPILLGAYYQPWSPELDALILAEHRRWSTLNLWIERAKPYQQAGRIENEYEAQLVDTALYGRLLEWGVELAWIYGSDDAGSRVAGMVKYILHQREAERREG